jgi:hypothetical protein
MGHDFPKTFGHTGCFINHLDVRAKICNELAQGGTGISLVIYDDGSDHGRLNPGTVAKLTILPDLRFYLGI